MTTTTRLGARVPQRKLGRAPNGLLRAAGIGVALGGLGMAAIALGLWQTITGAASALSASLTHIVGPVWVPMLLVGLRVLWLAARALRTRLGMGPFGEAVRPELTQLAPLFAAFGLAGTVWGLTSAFEALEGGEFLDRLPALLAGLGAAMTSTLVGLSLQIVTLLIAAYNPAWSLASVSNHGERELVTLDGRPLGEGEPGLEQLIETLAARQPEALHLDLDLRLASERRARIHTRVWKSLEGSIPLRPESPRSHA